MYGMSLSLVQMKEHFYLVAFSLLIFAVEVVDIFVEDLMFVVVAVEVVVVDIDIDID